MTMERMTKLLVIAIAVALVAGIGIPVNSDARELTIVSWGGAYQSLYEKDRQKNPG